MSKAPVLRSVVPNLVVGNLAEAIDFYGRVLGFQVAWQWGDPPHLASVCRDQVEIHLSQPPEKKRGISDIYFHLSGVDELYQYAVRAGVKVLLPLGDREYGIRDFRIADSSGNELSFGEVIES